MKEKYQPILETKDVCIYQKGKKNIIISDKEITFQTNKKILKRKRNRMENKKERYHSQAFMNGKKEAYFEMREFLENKSREREE